MRELTLSIIALIALNGCVSTAPSAPSIASYTKPTPQKEAAFTKTMINVAKAANANPTYNRIALDTDEKKQWFKKLMYRLWDRQITREQFINEGLKRYPTHKNEFDIIARNYQLNS